MKYKAIDETIEMKEPFPNELDAYQSSKTATYFLIPMIFLDLPSFVMV
jgi:hypothetical protein